MVSTNLVNIDEKRYVFCRDADANAADIWII